LFQESALVHFFLVLITPTTERKGAFPTSLAAAGSSGLDDLHSASGFSSASPSQLILIGELSLLTATHTENIAGVVGFSTFRTA
jgi:hypothetical protein